jgi:uncharacterized protein YjbI with pentapeptide repeats
MANEEHFRILHQGVETWKRWREEHPTIQPNLREIDLDGAHLGGIQLQEADLRWISLREVDLCEADLRGADCSDANLQRANLSQAKLHRTTLLRAYLSEANLEGVELWETLFADTNLTSVRGLVSCHHLGPSMIDYRTLLKSERLPLVFLRGCGLPESFITPLPTLLNDPTQHYSVFISYSHQDEPFDQRLYDALQGKGVRCWYAPEDIQGGKKIHEQIDAAIHAYDKLLLVLSDHSMNSEWVKTEIANARRREGTQNRRMLFPIRLVDFEIIRNWTYPDAETGKDSAREIREYYIPDFSNWKDHDSFEQAFTRLLRDLKADETSPST